MSHAERGYSYRMTTVRFAWVLVAALALAACGREEPVRQYTVSKDPPWKWRLLGAIAAPVGERVWFFKVVGPVEKVQAARETTRGFINSLQFVGGRPNWTLPSGWSEIEAGGMRYATLHLGGGEGHLEMSIIQLPRRANQSLGFVIADNVDRWRIQMGLYPVRPLELGGVEEAIDVNGTFVTVVEFDGPMAPPAPQAMVEPPQRQRPPPTPSVKDIRRLFAYEVPPGWVENPEPRNRRILEFRTGEGDREAEVTFTGFPGTMGGVGPNVNRWRDQAGLSPLEDSVAAKEAEPFPFMGEQGHIIVAKGAKHSVVVVFTLGEKMSMFLKMSGLPAVVEANLEPFKSLARSLMVSPH